MEPAEELLPATRRALAHRVAKGQAEGRDAAREKFRSEAAEIYSRLSTPEGWLTLWGDRAGKDAAHDRDTAEYLALLHRDGWANGDGGWWDDWSAFLSPWGFGLDAIIAPVSLWHGLADTRCPPAHSRWLAERIPHVTAHFPEHEDHTNIEENYRVAAYTWLRRCIGSLADETRQHIAQ